MRSHDPRRNRFSELYCAVCQEPIPETRQPRNVQISHSTCSRACLLTSLGLPATFAGQDDPELSQQVGRLLRALPRSEANA